MTTRPLTCNQRPPIPEAASPNRLAYASDNAPLRRHLPGSPKQKIGPATQQRLQAVVRFVLNHSRFQNTTSDPTFDHGARPDRRRNPRVAFPFPLLLTPLDEQQIVRTELQSVAIGRFLSDEGLDFYHSTPLPFRRYLCLLPTSGHSFAEAHDPGPVRPDPAAKPGGIEVILQVNWSRCNELGCLESGGRFLG